MKCQSLISGKNKNNVSKCGLLIFFVRHAEHLILRYVINRTLLVQ